MNSATRMARIAGVEIFLDWSLLIIFALIVVSLATSAFPEWHPAWAPALRWTTAVAAAVLFLLSVLLHELSHAVVGRAQGMDVRRITLFIFGGAAHLQGEPPHWRAELLIAGVGPIVSFVIGIGCLALASSLGGIGAIDTSDEMASMLAELGPVTSLLVWLGSVNVILALFNLVPGFPLDGGRVLRALIWGVTGSVAVATRYAAMLGRVFAWVLIATGVAMLLGATVPIFGRGPVGGVWLMLIGWFLHSAALMSYRQLLSRRALHALTVDDVMSRELESVSPDMLLSTFVDEILLRNRGSAFPVVGDHQRLVGLVRLSDTRKLPRAQWETSRVRDVMRPVARLATVEPNAEAIRALEILRGEDVSQLPVVEGDTLRGVVRREDILKWISVRGEERAAIGDRAIRSSG